MYPLMTSRTRLSQGWALGVHDYVQATTRIVILQKWLSSQLSLAGSWSPARAPAAAVFSTGWWIWPGVYASSPSSRELQLLPEHKDFSSEPPAVKCTFDRHAQTALPALANKTATSHGLLRLCPKRRGLLRSETRRSILVLGIYYKDSKMVDSFPPKKATRLKSPTTCTLLTLSVKRVSSKHPWLRARDFMLGVKSHAPTARARRGLGASPNTAALSQPPRGSHLLGNRAIAWAANFTERIKEMTRRLSRSCIPYHYSDLSPGQRTRK